MEDQIKIVQANNGFRQAIISLLQSEKLPVEDLPATLDNFYVALAENNVIGVIGLEQHGDCGLLRSMAVNNQYRNKGIASMLVSELEMNAGGLGIGCIYLLTETAPQYFERKGYARISRDEVPKQIRVSSEFSSVCPVSAIVMEKPVASL